MDLVDYYVTLRTKGDVKEILKSIKTLLDAKKNNTHIKTTFQLSGQYDILLRISVETEGKLDDILSHIKSIKGVKRKSVKAHRIMFKKIHFTGEAPKAFLFINTKKNQQSEVFKYLSDYGGIYSIRAISQVEGPFEIIMEICDSRHPIGDSRDIIDTVLSTFDIVDENRNVLSTVTMFVLRCE